MAGGITRFTVSVPSDLLDTVDRVFGKGTTRSALVRKLFEDALRAADERHKVEEYIEGYRNDPQTEEELGWLDEVTVRSLREVPWE